MCDHAARNGLAPIGPDCGLRGIVLAVDKEMGLEVFPRRDAETVDIGVRRDRDEMNESEGL